MTAAAPGEGGAAVEGQLAGALVAADHEPVVVVQAQKRPVVQAVAVGARAARDLLPCPRGDLPEQGVGTVGGAAEADEVVAGHRQHLAHPAGLQGGPQPRVGAVDLVTGDPRRWDPSVQRAHDHGRGQGRLGRKSNLVGDAGRLLAVRVAGPGLGQVQLPVDHGMPHLAGIHQIDRDLSVLDPARGAGVLALPPTVVVPFLRSRVSSTTSTASGSPRCSTR
jgi:hypothetical protein